MSEVKLIEDWREEMNEELDINDSDTVEAIDKMYENPTSPPPARDWKPVVGEKVLVVDEATFERMEDDTIAVVRWTDGRYSLVPLSRIRPMTGRDGNSKRKE